MVSAVGSCLLNAGVLIGAMGASRWHVEDQPVEPAPAVLHVELSPEMLRPLLVPKTAEPAATAEAATPERPRFARTAGSNGPRPERARFFGEHNTQAASELAPTPGALEVPAQDGVEPRHGEISTVSSNYQDGELPEAPTPTTPTEPGALAGAPATGKFDPAFQAMPPAPAPPASELASSTEPSAQNPAHAAEPAAQAEPAARPAPADLLEGPRPVELPRRAEEPPAPQRQLADTQAAVPELPKPEPPNSEQAVNGGSLPKPAADPAFKGYQEKTRMSGSISRKGNAALDVADSPLGRYQAQLSRAVEQEWQRNCVRYRDLITPGFITVRFVVNSKGKVTALSFVEAVEVGEVQKGFTVNSIRNAAIPSMPADVARELHGEPLELTFNFYF